MKQSIKRDAFLDDLEIKKANALRLMAETKAWNDEVSSRAPKMRVKVSRARFNPDEL